MEELAVASKQLLAVVAAEPPAAAGLVVAGLVAVVMDLQKQHFHQDPRQNYDA